MTRSKKTVQTPEKLKGVVAFAARDLCDAEDVQRARGDIAGFLTGDAGLHSTGGVLAGMTKPPPAKLDDKGLRELQELTRAFLNSIVEGREHAGFELPSVATVKNPNVRFTFLPFRRGATVVSLSGELRDVFVLSLGFLLTSNSNVDLRRCRRDDCDKLFVRTRRQLYCSRRCVLRANKGEWRFREEVQRYRTKRWSVVRIAKKLERTPEDVRNAAQFLKQKRSQPAKKK
jgi:hypothetical protein